MPDNLVTHLECGLCSRKYEAHRVWNVCECWEPLFVRYHLAAMRERWPISTLDTAIDSMWRYAPALPVQHDTSIVSLGEGMTPLLQLQRTGRRIGSADLMLKDEGQNPTGSFKARGLSCAVSMCVELGVRKMAIASAGNAASALAAYTAAAALEAFIYMPQDAPWANYLQSMACGAKVTLVDGLIDDCVRIVNERKDREGWFDMSAFHEPYQIEGKKTAGYELAEQLGWELPDAIFFPTGDGAGIGGMWKAFGEMEALGWIGPERPKMIAVQAEHCQPLVTAFKQGAERTTFWEHASTVASGIRVAKPTGDFLVLRALRESRGTAVAVPDTDLIDAGIQLASEEGIFAAPEGAACVAAAERLIREGFLKSDDRIVLCNTGSGMKYQEAYSMRFPRVAAGETDKVGGLITPR